MTKGDYNVIVIGGGTAGANAARAARESGAERVLLIRNPDMPNTCIRRGCMPSKALLAMSARGLPFADAMIHKCRIIEEFETDLNQSLDQEDFDLLWGRADFADEETVRVQTREGDRSLSGKAFVIATGASGFFPPIAGLREQEKSRCFTSDDVTGLKSAMEEVPGRLMVLGAGPIGLEMATFFSRLGSEVMVVEMAERLLPHLDPEFGRLRLEASREEDAFAIHVGSKLTAVEKQAEGRLRARVEPSSGSPHEHQVDAILVATGRKPNLDGLNLDRLGLSLEKGNLQHDEAFLATENPRVYIAGDATGHHQLLHIAAKMGQTAGHNAAVGRPERAMDYETLNMAIIFEACPSAVIGLTEEKAREKSRAVLTASQDLSDNGRGITDGVKHGRMKLVVDDHTGCVLGGQMLGPYASETIHALSAIIHLGSTAGDMVNMTWYHPTYSELWHSLANQVCQEDRTICPGTP